ncbi:hypothetical protein K2X33_11365, partial [bacterium]|nr:hypothetical protein [bacterium]
MRHIGAAALVIAGLLSGCAGYSERVRAPRRLYESGLYDGAATELKSLAGRKDNDRLLYLMDLGMVYHADKKYKEAIETFLEAEKLADAHDFTSISQEVGSVVTNDDAKFYGGEEFEKLLINVYLALDYTFLGNWDDALVECRKVNHKIDMKLAQGQKSFEHNTFAKYLAATLFESQGDLNSAFVDYRTLYKWDRKLPLLGDALLRVSDRLQASQEFQEYKSAYPMVKDYRLGKGYGEVVLVLEQGKGPIKVPSYQMRLVPVFSRRNYTVRQ